jgi:hypothetical protein
LSLYVNDQYIYVGAGQNSPYAYPNRARGWSATGIPKVETLKQIGLWNFLNEETKTKITKMNG